MKLNKLYLAIIILIFGCVVSLAGALLAQQNKKIDEKANNETIMRALDMMEEQRKEDRADLKEDKADSKEEWKEQQKTNKQFYETIQKILIRMEKE